MQDRPAYSIANFLPAYAISRLTWTCSQENTQQLTPNFMSDRQNTLSSGPVWPIVGMIYQRTNQPVAK